MGRSKGIDSPGIVVPRIVSNAIWAEIIKGIVLFNFLNGITSKTSRNHRCQKKQYHTAGYSTHEQPSVHHIHQNNGIIYSVRNKNLMIFHSSFSITASKTSSDLFRSHIVAATTMMRRDESKNPAIKIELDDFSIIGELSALNAGILLSS